MRGRWCLIIQNERSLFLLFLGVILLGVVLLGLVLFHILGVVLLGLILFHLLGLVLLHVFFFGFRRCGLRRILFHLGLRGSAAIAAALAFGTATLDGAQLVLDLGRRHAIEAVEVDEQQGAADEHGDEGYGQQPRISVVARLGRIHVVITAHRSGCHVLYSLAEF